MIWNGWRWLLASAALCLVAGGAVGQTSTLSQTVTPPGIGAVGPIGNVLSGCGVAGSPGTGGNDLPFIQACINQVVNNASFTGEVFFPPPPSGAYNICDPGGLGIVLPGSAHLYAIQLVGTAGGGAVIQVKSGCATPPIDLMQQPSGGGNNSQARVHLEALTLNANYLATTDLHILYARGFSAANSVFKNVIQTTGINLQIDSGFEDHFDENDLFENKNDQGVEYYTSASILPAYNIKTLGTDSYFTGAIGVGARTNFYTTSNHWFGTHGWGYPASAEPFNVDLREQYVFEVHGAGDLDSCIMDSFTIAGVHIVASASSFSVRGCMAEGVSGTQSPGAIGVLLDSGVRQGLVVNGIYPTDTTADAIVQNGTADISTVVGFNIGPAGPASYTASLGIPSSYASPLTYSGGVVGFSYPAIIPANQISASGGLSAVNAPPSPPFYLISGGGSGNFPTVNVPAPTSGGSLATQGAVSVVAATLGNNGTITACGTGFLTGDKVTISGGTPLGSLSSNQYVATVTATGGCVSAFTYFSGSAYSSLPVDSSGVTWTALTGSGTGLITHGLQWEIDSSRDFSITTSGYGYVGTINLTFTAGAGATLVFGTQTTTAQTSSNLLLTGGVGQVLMDSVGTHLGVAGASGSPVINSSAFVDSSNGTSCGTVTSGSTITMLANTDLLCIGNTTAVAALTVKLPPVSGQGLQHFEIHAPGGITAETLLTSSGGTIAGAPTTLATGIDQNLWADATTWH